MPKLANISGKEAVREVARFLLKSQIKRAKLTENQFMELL